MDLNLEIVKLSDRKDLLDKAVSWFSSKWKIPKETYKESIEESFNAVIPSWYVALDGEKIVAGMGVIKNDFHPRKDLSPNVCAVYTERKYRKHGIAGCILNHIIKDLNNEGITEVYLLTNLIGFYERYGWEYLCDVIADGENKPSRMLVHRGK